MPQAQNELWLRVNSIHHRVLTSIGPELTAELRCSPAFQAYTNLHNDVVAGYIDGLLTPGIVELLDEYANKVIEFSQRVPA